VNISSNGSAESELESHGDVIPDTDGSHQLGTDANTWSSVWATDVTINSSDARLKKNIEI
jgi:hypothetical protein